MTKLQDTGTISLPDKIQPQYWEKTHFQFERKKIAQDVLNYYKQALNLPNEIKMVFKNHAENGVYNDKTKTITIHPKLLTSNQEYSGLHLLNIIAHESKHAWQYQLMHHKQNHPHTTINQYQDAIIINLALQSQNPYNGAYPSQAQIASINFPNSLSNVDIPKIEALHILQPSEYDAYAFAMKETTHYLQQYQIYIPDDQMQNRIIGGAQLNSAIMAFIGYDNHIVHDVNQLYRDMYYQRIQEQEIPLFVKLEQAMILTHMSNCNNLTQQHIDNILSTNFQTAEMERLTEMIHNLPARDDDEVIYEDEPDYAMEFQYGTEKFRDVYHLNDDKETQEQPSHKQSSHDDDEIDFP